MTLTLTGTNEESDVCPVPRRRPDVLDRTFDNGRKVQYPFVRSVFCHRRDRAAVATSGASRGRDPHLLDPGSTAGSRCRDAALARRAPRSPVGTKPRLCSHGAHGRRLAAVGPHGAPRPRGGAVTRPSITDSACRLVVALGSLPSVKGASGANAVAFSGRLHGSALKPGNYRATITATAAGLEPSSPRYVTFTVAPR